MHGRRKWKRKIKRETEIGIGNLRRENGRNGKNGCTGRKRKLQERERS